MVLLIKMAFIYYIYIKLLYVKLGCILISQAYILVFWKIYVFEGGGLVKNQS